MRYRIEEYFPAYSQWLPLQSNLWFDTLEEANQFIQHHIEECLGEASLEISPGALRAVADPNAPTYDVGFRFSNPAGLPFMITYRYLSPDSGWNYHVGLIICSESEVTPQTYQFCSTSVLNGSRYVDYCRATEEEIQNALV